MCHRAAEVEGTLWELYTTSSSKQLNTEIRAGLCRVIQLHPENLQGLRSLNLTGLCS